MSRLENYQDFSDRNFGNNKLVSKNQYQELLVEVLNTDHKFYELEDEWNNLLSNSTSDSIFLTWEWVSTWWKYFHENSSPWIITVRHPDTNQLLGIAPLAIKSIRNMVRFFDQTLIFIGNGTAAPDHLDFIIMKGYEDSIADIFSETIWDEQYNWNQIRFDGIASNSPVIHRLLQQHPITVKKIDRTICPFLSLPDNWKTLYQSLSKNMRYSLGRFERRLDKDYPNISQFKKITDPAEVKGFISTLVELHTASQKRKDNTGLFIDQNMIDFHTELAGVFLRNGWLRSYTLDVGKTSIAALHCFQYKNRVSFYQSGFDQFWQRYSPGTQIMAHAIKEAIKENNNIFDFLRGDEDYKYKWTESYETNLKFVIPFSLPNQIGLQLKEFGRKLIAHS